MLGLQRVSSSLMLAAVIALSACGGGGGGSGGGGSGPIATGTGLLPTAPTPGATLQADASVYRPLKQGAVWSYRGSSVPSAGAAPIIYSTSITQSAVTATGANEAVSNSENGGPYSQTLSVSGGVVSNTQSVDFPNTGVPQTLTDIEIKSPVRQGEQYTILDQHYANTKLDADGDGKFDALDVAIYARVAGLETLNLPNLPSMQALRVDTTLLTRVTFSSTGKNSTVVQSSAQVWYVAGVGIVRQVTNVPTATGGVATTDEQLVSWDATTSGVGALTPVSAVVPAGNTVLTPGQSLPYDASGPLAFGFGDHALVLTRTTNWYAAKMDTRGNVQSVTLLPWLNFSASGSTAAYPNGILHLEPQFSGAYQDLSLTNIDANGVLVGTAGGVTLHLGGNHVTSFVAGYKIAADSATLWVLWARNYYDPAPGATPSYEFVLRPFAFDGTPLAAEMIVDPGLVGEFSVATNAGRAILHWARPPVSGGQDLMVATATVNGIFNVQKVGTSTSTIGIFPTLFSLGVNSALVWDYPMVVGATTQTVGGLLLDTGMTPVHPGATWLENQISGVPAPASGQVTAGGSRMAFFGSSSNATLWPGDISTQTVDSVYWLDTTANSSLANTSINRVNFAGGWNKTVLAFPDRVLVFGGQIGLTTTVIWMNKGS